MVNTITDFEDDSPGPNFRHIKLLQMNSTTDIRLSFFLNIITQSGEFNASEALSMRKLGCCSGQSVV